MWGAQSCVCVCALARVSACTCTGVHARAHMLIACAVVFRAPAFGSITRLLPVPCLTQRLMTLLCKKSSPLLGQALPHAWDKPALGTGPSTCLGQARSWDKPTMACMRMYVWHACSKAQCCFWPRRYASEILAQLRSWPSSDLSRHGAFRKPPGGTGASEDQVEGAANGSQPRGGQDFVGDFE